jgi:ribosomal protein L13
MNKEDSKSKTIKDTKIKTIALILKEEVSQGRFCSYIAKRLLKEDSLVIIVPNDEKIIKMASQKVLKKDLLIKRARGSRYRGPFYPKRKSEQIRRSLRGMLPKKISGVLAYKRFFIGDVEKIKNIMKRRKLTLEVVDEVFETSLVK